MRDSLAISVEALSGIELSGYGLERALSSALSQFSVTDRRIMGEARFLATEVLRRRNLIDLIIEKAVAPRKLGSLKLGVQNFLRVYTFQSNLLGAKRDAHIMAGWGRMILGWKNLAPVEEAIGMIPGVKAMELLKGMSEDESISFQTFHPQWYVRYCLGMLEREEAIALLERDAKPPSRYIRVNTLTTDEADLVRELSEKRVELKKVEGLDHVYKVEKAEASLAELRAHRQGKFSLQDKSSSLVVEVLHPKPGEVVFDLCAAPGIKTVQICQMMGNEGSVHAIDYSSERMKSLKTFLRRMEATNVEPIIADARKALPLNTRADRVLLDPPCSGTGVFWKAPAMKWSTTESTVRRLSRIQSGLIESAAESVKTGGTLVYSTCSVMVEENEMVIEHLLRSRPEFALVEAAPRLGSPGLRGLAKCQRLYPHSHDANGCFIAKLVRGD